MIRLAAPAPVANNNGMTLEYKGERSHQDRTQADVSGFERFAYRITGGTVVAANSTIRIPFFAERAISRIIPICV